MKMPFPVFCGANTMNFNEKALLKIIKLMRKCNMVDCKYSPKLKVGLDRVLSVHRPQPDAISNVTLLFKHTDGIILLNISRLKIQPWIFQPEIQGCYVNIQGCFLSSQIISQRCLFSLDISGVYCKLLIEIPLKPISNSSRTVQPKTSWYINAGTDCNIFWWKIVTFYIVFYAHVVISILTHAWLFFEISCVVFRRKMAQSLNWVT